MGNQQNGSYPNSASNSSTNLAGIVRKSARSSRLKMAELLDLRRRSVGTAVDAIKREEASAHNNYRSFTYGQSSPRSFDGGEQSSSEEHIVNGKSQSQQFGPIPPRIEINGVQNETKESSSKLENAEKPSENGGTILMPRELSDQRRGSGCSLPSYSKHRAQKVDSRKIVARKRLEREQITTNAPSNGGGIYTKNNTKCNQHPLMASIRASDLAQSLDTNIKCNMEICNEIKPLNVRSTRSVPPLLHQHRRIFGSNGGSHRGSLFASSFSGDDGILSKEQSDAIRKSWHLAKQRIKQFAGDDRCFGFFAFDRIFERAPELKPLFGISPNISLIDMDENQMELHPFIRHIRIFTNILDLSVRNATELETEILPALFTYGQRHYRPKIIEQFNERTVRLFCSQIVGTICDLLNDELSPFAKEAWIEMVTYLGRALLSGFEHERQSQGGKRFSLQKIH